MLVRGVMIVSRRMIAMVMVMVMVVTSLVMVDMGMLGLLGKARYQAM